MKRYIVLIFLLVLTPVVVLAYKPGDKYIKGDADNSGKVTSVDYVIVRNHMFKKTTLTGDTFTRADVNGDNKITLDDHNAIKTMIWNGKTREVVTVPGGTSTPTPKPTNTPAPTATPKPLTAEEKICESVKNNSSIDYKSFASLKKDKDDYYAIKVAHDCANKYNKPVVVTKGTYHIYKKNTDTITVETNTDLGDSTIYIHDEYEDIYKYIQSDNGHIYTIKPNKTNSCTTKTISGFNNAFTSLAPTKGNYSVLITEKNGKKVWHRNKGTGELVQETTKGDIYRVFNGVVQDPMYWDYKISTIEYTVCPIPNEQLVFKNATIKTITRNKVEKYDGYAKRGIKVLRNNTKISNIKHSFIDKNGKYVDKINHRYSAIFNSSKVVNLVIENCQVYALYYQVPSSGRKDSTYDLQFTNSANILLNNVYMYDDVEQMKDNDKWGVMASNGCKNVVVENSKLNRIDAHKGMYNLTVRNSTIGSWGINIVGSGDRKDNKVVLDNVTWKYTSKLLNMRGDYGSTWNGTISITNSKVRNTTDTLTIVSTSTMSRNIGYKFGQPIYNPTKVKIDGLEIKSSNTSKIRIFDESKTDFENYYLKHFQRKKNPNESTVISKKNITGVSSSSIRNYG